MKTRCKFKCITVEGKGTENAPTFDVTFEAVIEGSEENKSFFRYTPSGQLDLHVCRENMFKAGKEYYLDITPCDEDAPPPAE